MTYETRERFFKYVYLAFGCMFVVSLVLLAFMKGIAPFNVGVSWSGSSLVLTQYQADPATGKRVARTGSIVGEVAVYSVLETYRENGELYYRTTPVTPGSEEVLSARSAQRVVVASVPVLGLWVRALNHPIGALALLGIPLLTFALDLILAASGSAVLYRTRVLVTRFVRGMERRRAERRIAAAVIPDTQEEEDVYEEAYEEITPPAYTGPRTVPQNFGMTITLTRPRRYGM